MAKNKYIKKIGINGNSLGNEGAKGLGEGLLDNSSLKWLEISDCKIGDEGKNYLSFHFLLLFLF